MVYAGSGILNAERFRKLRATCLKNKSIRKVRLRDIEEMEVDDQEETDDEEDSDMDEEMGEANVNHKQGDKQEME